jgi:hypothetical protein
MENDRRADSRRPIDERAIPIRLYEMLALRAAADGGSG